METKRKMKLLHREGTKYMEGRINTKGTHAPHISTTTAI
jgi:hypothetical protein